MTTLDKAKRILRGAKGHHSTVNRDQWRKGYDTGKADARFGYFGQTARRSNFGYSYCRGYLLGWRSISHGAKSIHHFRRYPEELQHDSKPDTAGRGTRFYSRLVAENTAQGLHIVHLTEQRDDLVHIIQAQQQVIVQLADLLRAYTESFPYLYTQAFNVAYRSDVA